MHFIRFKNTYFFALLLLFGLLTRFIFFGTPKTIIFDEVYFAKYATDYTTGSYYFDVHPPLGKLLIHAMGEMGGVTSDPTSYTAIGNAFDERARLFYRFLPALAGALLPALIFALALALGFSSGGALVAGLLVLLDNSLLVQARFVSIDGLLVLFGFASLLFYALARRESGKKVSLLLVASAIFGGMAGSVKWTGLAYPLAIVLWETISLFDRTKIREGIYRILKFIGLYAVVGTVLYVLFFSIHFAFLTKSGPGDLFMSDRFQKTLEGNSFSQDETIQSKGFFGKVIELNLEMFYANQSMTAPHPYSSKWYTWPLMTRTVFYWQEAGNAGMSKFLYFIGNPLIYWLGSFSILYLTWLVVARKVRDKLVHVLLVGYAVNFIPFIFIGRVMFIYHYQAALIFSIMATAYLLQYRHRLAYFIVSLCILSFLFFAPLSYGWPLSDNALHARMWLSSWR